MKINPKYEEAKEYYLTTKESLTKVSKLYGIDRGKFSIYLKEQNIVVENFHNKPKLNEKFFDKIETEIQAYWLGFMYADGYVADGNNNNIELSLKASDIEHLKKFANDLNFVNKNIYTDNVRCRLSFRNKHMKSSLIELGCTPKKSLTLSFPTEEKVPSFLIHHFVRGYIDGDGSVMVSQTLMPRLHILGTYDFLSELQEKMNWLEDTKSRPHPRKNIYSLEFGGSYVARFLNDIYSNASVFLDRKYEKYLEIKQLADVKSGKKSGRLKR